MVVKDDTDKVETGKLDEMAAGAQARTDLPPLAVPGHDTPKKVEFAIGEGSTRRVKAEVLDRFIIGRADEGEEHRLGLDLGPHGGLDNGVSRHHAVIEQRGRQLYILDFGSTNGTRINGLNLKPDKLYRLRTDDELELGLVRVVIRFSE